MSATKQFHSAVTRARDVRGLCMQNFAGLDADDPEAMQAMLENALGRHGAQQMWSTFDKHLKVTQVRFWVHRPDLSYTPGM